MSPITFAMDLHAATLLGSGKKGRIWWKLRRGRYHRRRQRRAGEAPKILGEEPAKVSSGERRMVGGEEREKWAFVSLLGGPISTNLQETDMELLLKRRWRPRSKPFA
jgi:hypothetical protein